MFIKYKKEDFFHEKIVNNLLFLHEVDGTFLGNFETLYIGTDNQRLVSPFIKTDHQNSTNEAEFDFAFVLHVFKVIFKFSVMP